MNASVKASPTNGVKPGEVNEDVVDRFIDYRSRCGKPAEGP